MERRPIVHQRSVYIEADILPGVGCLTAAPMRFISFENMEEARWIVRTWIGKLTVIDTGETMRLIGTVTSLLAIIVTASSVGATENVLPQTGARQLSYSQPAQIISDVVLGENRRLVGRVINGQGHSVSGIAVSLRRPGQKPVLRVTDGTGTFSYIPVSGGVYELSTDHGRELIRVWTTIAAPPSARAQATVVEAAVTRGQTPGPWQGTPPRRLTVENVHRWLNNPWVQFGAITTAVAVPLTIDSNNSSSSGAGSLSLDILNAS